MQTAIPKGPYRDNSVNQVYELLFCDKPDLFITRNSKDSFPFNVIISENSTEADLQQVVDDQHADPRVRLLAYNKLAKTGHAPPRKELIGVIVEVGLDEGLDTLACYNNFTARYINHTGSMVVWETNEDEKANQLISELFGNSSAIIDRIGPWNQPRKPAPATGMTRISFLVSDGLYFGEAPTDVLFNDPMAGPALANATAILQYITEQTVEKNK